MRIGFRAPFFALSLALTGSLGFASMVEMRAALEASASAELAIAEAAASAALSGRERAELPGGLALTIEGESARALRASPRPMGERALREHALVMALFAIGASAVLGIAASFLISLLLRGLHDRARDLASAIPRPSARDERAHGSLTSLADDLVAAIEEITRERDRFGAVLESMTEAVVALDADLRVRLTNQAARQLFAPQIEALGGAGVVGARVSALMRNPAILELIESAQRGRASRAELELSGPPARRVMIETVPGGRAAGVTPGVVLVMRDVTELRMLETMRRDFVANVSHEIRTPIAVVMLNAETLIADEALGAASPQARRFLEALYQNAERLNKLVADLLDISRIEAGRWRLELEPVSVFGAALRAIDSLEKGASAADVDLDTAIAPDLFAFADEKALEQVLVNLIENALKYTPAGGEVIVRARLEGDRSVLLEVCDTGPGIDPAHRARVFERFYRVDEGRSREVGGTGLGLSIVKHLSQAMGGRVGVRAHEPRGSIFWVRLRSAQPGDEVEAAPVSPVEVIAEQDA